jgi:hypothetical protein
MLTVHKEFMVNVPPQVVWDVVKDVGALHTRLFRGYAANARATAIYASCLNHISVAVGCLLKLPDVDGKDGHFRKHGF